MRGRPRDLATIADRLKAVVQVHLKENETGRVAAKTGLSEGTVKRAIRLLERRGYLKVIPDQGRRSSRYQLLLVERAAEKSPELNASIAAGTGSDRAPQRVQTAPREESPATPGLLREPLTEEGEKDGRASARDSPILRIREGRQPRLDRRARRSRPGRGQPRAHRTAWLKRNPPAARNPLPSRKGPATPGPAARLRTPAISSSRRSGRCARGSTSTMRPLGPPTSRRRAR
jgi:DNA-binding MarR family transcriptional regulator